MTKRRKAMTHEEFIIYGFIFGLEAFTEIYNLAMSNKHTPEDLNRRVRGMVDRDMVLRRRAVRRGGKVRTLILSGRYDEARRLVEKGGAR